MAKDDIKFAMPQVTMSENMTEMQKREFESKITTEYVRGQQLYHGTMKAQTNQFLDAQQYTQEFQESQRAEKTAEFQQLRDKQVTKIQSNREMGWLKKKKAVREANKTYGKNVANIQVPVYNQVRQEDATTMMAAETQAQLYRTAQETSTMSFLSEEHQKLVAGDSTLKDLLHHGELHGQKNQQLIESYGGGEGADPLFVMRDMMETINHMDMSLFTWSSFGDFCSRYTKIYQETQRASNIVSSIFGKLQDRFLQLKEEKPEGFQEFEDRLEYLQRATTAVNMYASHKGSLVEQNMNADFVKHLQNKEELQGLADHRSGMQVLQKTYDFAVGTETLESRKAKRAEYKKRQENCIAMRQRLEKEKREGASMEYLLSQKQAYNALVTETKKYLSQKMEAYSLGDIFEPELEAMPLTHVEQSYTTILKNKDLMKIREAEILGARFEDTLQNQHTIQPNFRAAVLELFKGPNSVHNLKIKEDYATYYQEIKRLEGDVQAANPDYVPLGEFPDYMVITERDLQLYKLSGSAYVMGDKSLGESLFRTFRTFGSMPALANYTVEQLKTMLLQLAAGKNNYTEEDAPEEIAKNEAANLQGFQTYREIIRENYQALTDQLGKCHDFTIEEIRSRKDQFVPMWLNGQVDQHFVGRFPELWQDEENQTLKDQIEYYNITAILLSAVMLENQEAGKMAFEMSQHEMKNDVDLQARSRRLFGE